MPPTEVANLFAVLRGTVSKVVTAYTVSGKALSDKHNGGRHGQLTERQEDIVQDCEPEENTLQK